MITFPADKLPQPRTAKATNVGDSYVEKISDSTVESKTDAGYRITRPRNTRTPRTFSYAWTCLTAQEMSVLRDFWVKVRKSDMFMFTDYDSGAVVAVRFVTDWESHYAHPEGYCVALQFEEV